MMVDGELLYSSLVHDKCVLYASMRNVEFTVPCIFEKTKRGTTKVTVASYRTRRHRLAEEVPGLYIRRLTLEDPKTARDQRPDSGLQQQQSPARHVCHPRASYVPAERPTSSYRTWLEQIRRERQAVLTITSLQLPECPVPLIESLANKCCRAPSARDAGKDETLNEILVKVAETKPRTPKQPKVNGQTIEDSGELVNENYEIENCCQENDSAKGTSTETPTYDDVVTNNTDDDDIDTLNESYDNVAIIRNNGNNVTPLRNQDCMCMEIPDNLRINIRKKTEVRRRSSGVVSGARSPSPEVTHTIRIAMKYHGQQQQQQQQTTTREQASATLDDEDEETPATTPTSKRSTCCPGVSVALDFTLNCNSVQLTSRDVTVRPITATASQQQVVPSKGIKIKSAKD